MQFKLTDLRKFNTLNLPAQANLAVLSDEKQLASLFKVEQPLFFLGGGSNVIMAEQVAHKVVLLALKGIDLIAETPSYFMVQAGAGEIWHDFVKFCLRHNWCGLENLALIPGTVGAAPVQNIGAYGVELEQLIDSVTALNMQTQKTYQLSKADCEFAYRDSMFKRSGFGNWLILKVNFKLPKVSHINMSYPDLQKHQLLQKPNVYAQDIFAAVCDIRKNKLPDPNILPNAGSFFKNPIVAKSFTTDLKQKYPDLRYFSVDQNTDKLAAGWLIDQAGWRGKSLGPVGMHKKQALVMVNHGGAVANDVLRLADKIKADVKNKFNVSLEQEPVNLV